jgi:hypothetical protein
MSTLIIIPCGAAKVWKDAPCLWTEVSADLAYTSTIFKLNRSFAEHFADRWLILSARYGLLEPTDLITDYDQYLGQTSVDNVTPSIVCDQIRTKGLDTYSRVIAIGGEHYRRLLSEAFSKFKIEVHFPFAGLEMGRGMSAVKQALKENNPLPKTPLKNVAASTTSGCGQKARTRNRKVKSSVLKNG